MIPMTDERWESIKRIAADGGRLSSTMTSELLAEIDRLRAEVANQKLRVIEASQNDNAERLYNLGVPKTRSNP